jgi:hypothetical protein
VARTHVSPAERVLSARLAAYGRWSRKPDRHAALAPARAGLEARFVREVDPEGVLPPVELAKRVARARQAC